MTVDLESMIAEIKAITLKNFDYCIEDKDKFFPPGATDEEIKQFETEYKVSLPDEVREYLKLMNGEGAVKFRDRDTEVGAFLGLSVLSIPDIKREMDCWKQVWEENPSFEEDLYESVPEGAVNAQYVDPYHWVGLTVDGCGNSIGIDLNPGPNGTYGQVLVWGRDYYDTRVVIFKSWTEFIASVLKDLKKENYSIDKEYNVYDYPEINYIDYVFERESDKLKHVDDKDLLSKLSLDS